MKASSDLLMLVKTLSKTEKTYFKKFSSRHTKNSSNNYTVLFDALDNFPAGDNYDEGTIRKKFKGIKFAEQLPVTKNYLYGNILKSLAQYHAAENTDIKINSMIDSAGLLYRKGLFSQCIKITSRAKEITARHGKYALMLNIIQIERRALRARSSLNESAEELKKNYTEESEILKKIKNISLYERLFDEAVILTTARGPARNEAAVKMYDRFLSNPLLKFRKHAEYLQSKIIFHQLHCVMNRMKYNFRQAYFHGSETIRLIEEEEKGMLLAPYHYIIALQNVIDPAFRLGKKTEAEESLRKLESKQDEVLVNYPGKVKNFLASRTLLYRVNFNLSRGYFEENRSLISKALDMLKISGSSYRDENIVTNFAASINHFALGEFSESLKYLNLILNSKTFPLRSDLQVSCRILNLLLHYELGNYEYAQSNLKSTLSYLKKMKSLYSSEKLVLILLKDLLKSPPEKEAEFLLRKAGKELEMNFRIDNTGSVIDLRAWIESKLENKPIASIVNKK